MENTKTCTRCNVPQNEENFYIRRTRNNQRKSICKECESKQKAKPLEIIENLTFYDDEGNMYLEEWKDIPGYEGIYQASTAGRIKRIMHRKNPTNTIVNYSFDGGGYLKASFMINGKPKTALVHRQIALTFIPNPDNLPEVNHIKGVKTDNRYFMLEWNTSQQNIRHSWDNGLSKSLKGEKHNFSKLTENEVLEIRASSLSPLELSIQYNVLREQIYKILRRERWKHI